MDGCGCRWLAVALAGLEECYGPRVVAPGETVNALLRVLGEAERLFYDLARPGAEPADPGEG